MHFDVKVRWPEAEEVHRQFRVHEPPPYDLADLVRTGKMSAESAEETKEVRYRAYPVGSVSITSDEKYFSRPSPLVLAKSELPRFLALVTKIADVFRQRIVAEFRQYCVPSELAKAAAISISSRLSMNDECVANVLAQADEKDWFARWLQDYRERAILRKLNAKVKERQERYFSLLAGRWSKPH